MYQYYMHREKNNLIEILFNLSISPVQQCFAGSLLFLFVRCLLQFFNYYFCCLLVSALNDPFSRFAIRNV